MNKLEYKQYIYSKEWNTLRDAFLEQNKACAGCGETFGLDIHHKTYDRVGHETLNDLVLLCRYCHFSTHYFYKSMLNEFYAGKTPFKHSLEEVTNFLLSDAPIFYLVVQNWIAKEKAENNGWIKISNSPGTFIN